MTEVKVPEYVLKDIENTLRLWANINDSYKKETCLDVQFKLKSLNKLN